MGWQTILHTIMYLFSFQVAFIRDHIPSDVKIHLICHSIGSYVALKLFKIDSIRDRIIQCCLLFPTFEFMAASPSGQTYINTLQYFFQLLFFGAKLLDLFPRYLRAFLVRIVFWIRGIPEQFIDATLNLIRPKSLSKIVCMADTEMEDVLEPDYATIKENVDRLQFIYSKSDGWTPATYYDRLKSYIPNAKAVMTDHFEHTFTLKENYGEMAQFLVAWINAPGAQYSDDGAYRKYLMI